MPTGYSKKTGENPFKGKKRKPFSLSHRLKISKASKGRKAWNKGLKGLQKHSEETRIKMSKSHSDEKHHEWKGDKVGYSALHSWIKRKKGLAKFYECIFCGAVKNLQWANRNHKYTRDLDDWIVFCAKCHNYYDKYLLKVKFGRKKI